MKEKIVTIVRDRQSTIASGLAALLIIVGGFLVFNAFNAGNKVKAPSITPEATQSAQVNQNQGFPVNADKPASLGAQNVSLPTTYTVVRGDNLSAIAKRFYGDGDKWTELAKANRLASPSVIHAGNVLSIPKLEAPAPSTQANTSNAPVLGASTTTVKSGATYTVKAGDTLWDIATSAYGSGYEWYRIDQANSPIARNANGKPLILPGQNLKIP